MMELQCSLSEEREYQNLEREQQETRVNLGAAFSRWTSLKRDKCFQSDVEVACFLLDSYERGATASAPMKKKLFHVSDPKVSIIGASGGADRWLYQKSTSGVETPQINSLPAAPADLVQTHVRRGPDIQQMLPIKEEVPSSPTLEKQDQQDSNLLCIKKEPDELLTSQEGEQQEEADITKVLITAVPVKTEHDEEKPEVSQLYQRSSEDNREAEPPASSSARQIKTETDFKGPESVRNSCPISKSQPNACGKPPDSYETEVSIDDDEWKDPLSDSECDTEDSSSDWKESNASESGVKSFNCSECDKQFQYKRSLQRHMTHHSGNMPSSSFWVNKKRGRLKQSTDSQVGFHTGEKPFGCDICGKSFNQNSHLRAHMKIHSGEKPFHCNVCEKRFRNQYNCNRHMRLHTGDKPFGCGVCGQRYNCNRDLETHMRAHTGEKPFACGVCSKRFSQPGVLKRHRTIHTGEKPFGCEVCGKRFNREGNLNTHKRVHTGEKPFSCEICGQRFNQSTNLKTHMKTHSGEKPFCCSVCGERFTREGSLKRHMRRQTINHLNVVKDLHDSSLAT